MLVDGARCRLVRWRSLRIPSLQTLVGAAGVAALACRLELSVKSYEDAGGAAPLLRDGRTEMDGGGVCSMKPLQTIAWQSQRAMLLKCP